MKLMQAKQQEEMREKIRQREGQGQEISAEQKQWKVEEAALDKMAR
jgi:hypothetical protein